MKREINTENLQFYKKQAIGIATFIGGPIAAGYLIRENYKALNQTEKGNNILIISILATIAMFVLIFSIPEKIMEKVPNVILPAAYTAAIVFWVEQTFGTILKQHEENNYSFYSVWRAVGIGVVSFLILGLGIFGYAYASTDVEAENLYFKTTEKFYENEEASLTFYQFLQTKNDFDLLVELNKNVIPKWKENLEIVKSADTITNLPEEIRAYNKKLLRYTELRIEAFELFKKAISENTDAYNSQLEYLHKTIDKQLESINK